MGLSNAMSSLSLNPFGSTVRSQFSTGHKAMTIATSVAISAGAAALAFALSTVTVAVVAALLPQVLFALFAAKNKTAEPKHAETSAQTDPTELEETHQQLAQVSRQFQEQGAELKELHAQLTVAHAETAQVREALQKRMPITTTHEVQTENNYMDIVKGNLILKERIQSLYKDLFNASEAPDVVTCLQSLQKVERVLTVESMQVLRQMAATA